MYFKNKLTPATLIRRYKRFLADVILDDGSTLTAYCPNTGSMKSCAEPGSRVYLSRSANLKRKYPFTLEMVYSGECWIGVNTGLTNQLVVEAVKAGKISELGRVETIYTEIKVSRNSRLDIMVETGGKKTYIEVKNCSLVENGIAMFPDAVTTRGTKHLLELADLVQKGHGGMILYLVQRTDAKIFKPAEYIDPEYARMLRAVSRQGVKALVYQAKVQPQGIEVIGQLPFSLSN